MPNKNDFARITMPESAELPEKPISTDILQSVHARLWREEPFKEPVLALEVIYGPYKGVVFKFETFTMMPEKKLENGMVPVKFETKVLRNAPDFFADEAWDAYCAEIFVSWLHYVHTNDLPSTLRNATVPGIH